MLESNCPRGRHIRPREKDVSLGLMCRTLRISPRSRNLAVIGNEWRQQSSAEQEPVGQSGVRVMSPKTSCRGIELDRESSVGVVSLGGSRETKKPQHESPGIVELLMHQSYCVAQVVAAVATMPGSRLLDVSSQSSCFMWVWKPAVPKYACCADSRPKCKGKSSNG